MSLFKEYHKGCVTIVVSNVDIHLVAFQEFTNDYNMSLANRGVERRKAIFAIAC